MERRNDAFDEFLIDPVPQAAHSSLSLSERFSVTNALSEKRHEDLLDMLINEEAAPPLQLGCPEQHFHNDVSRPSVHRRQPGESERAGERKRERAHLGTKFDRPRDRTGVMVVSGCRSHLNSWTAVSVHIEFWVLRTDGVDMFLSF